MKTRRRLPVILSRQALLPPIVLAVAVVLSYLALTQPWVGEIATPALQAGQVAQQDLRAPYSHVFVSQALTEAARAAAEQRVEPVYAPADPAIARSQAEALADTLHEITAIRTDAATDLAAKKSALALLDGVALSEMSISLLVTVSTERWDIVQAEARSVLENVMRNPIRNDDLESATQNLPSLVSLSMSVEEVQLVVELVSPLVTANSFYSPELTALVRESERNSVEAVVVSYAAGQTIVGRGEVISEAGFEALSEMGLVQNIAGNKDLVGAGALVVVLAVFTALYYFRRRPPALPDMRSLFLVAGLFLLFLAAARLTIPGRTVIPYLFPLPAFGLLVSVLFGMESGVMFSLALGLLAAYGLPTTLDLSLYYIISSLCGILAMGNARRATGFLRAGLVSSLAGMGILAAFHWPHYEMDWLGMATLAGASVFNGLASASLALLAQFFLANWLGLTTALQLHEISRPDFPLLQYFLRRAPGTYQHSLQAVNLAEQAAEKIGADALLTRVGGLFHDIGKAANPAFFIENQTPGNLDTHDDMDPGEAARTIIRHVADGLELAQKHHLPHRIRDFITEHHGTLVTRYQFNRAAEQSGKNKTKLNVDDFRYPGPEPRSRETAILMLADGVEARVRAERPKDEEGLAAIVRSVIERCQKESQFDHTSLTQNDLRLISESFVASLRGTFHPRLEYPKDQLDFPTTPLKRGK